MLEIEGVKAISDEKARGGLLAIAERSSSDLANSDFGQGDRGACPLYAKRTCTVVLLRLPGAAQAQTRT
jgi:hypothetical protein